MIWIKKINTEGDREKLTNDLFCTGYYVLFTLEKKLKQKRLIFFVRNKTANQFDQKRHTVCRCEVHQQQHNFSILFSLLMFRELPHFVASNINLSS